MGLALELQRKQGDRHALRGIPGSQDQGNGRRPEKDAFPFRDYGLAKRIS
jgi:hypothetical protein